ncbi:sodium/potassium-transporting ATPase subunit beta-1 [Agrilus planipennis]|uniref:Sodium/potassium-transporting ATPase subunit beta-1 n=1 Tax=Agrilus planipennis TaxID=224129 RepID=A0A1W4WPD8_AGRPL|nr:sodium/potassium-transporting ATPase subunit beta-1 [Agrilus planipennis]
MSIAGREKTENGTFDFPYMKPPTKTTWETIKTALWNPDTKEVFGRTGKNWAQLLLFYTIFYAILAAFFAICMKGLLATLNDKSPRWTLDSSIIGTNPGIGFRPISNQTEEGSLIWFDSKNNTSIQKWVKLLDQFFDAYKKKVEVNKQNQVNCDFDRPPQNGQVCTVDLDSFGPCSPTNEYGYNSSSPCVFLKLNKIYGWQPEYYSDPDNLPDDMPSDLVEYIKNNANSKEKLKQVWISCYGEFPADKENIFTFEYYPTRGFPSYFYPYTNEPGYLSPLIAVKLNNPKPNVLINIECRAWAKNINYRSSNLQREGSIHFELMRDV